MAALGALLARPEKIKQRGTHPLAEMLGFVNEYGVLGVSDPTGRRESLVEFTVAAARVWRTLRLYEAATANDGDGDEDKLLRLYQSTTVHGRDALRERAFSDASRTIAEHLETRAYPAVYQLQNKAGRTVSASSAATAFTTC